MHQCTFFLEVTDVLYRQLFEEGFLLGYETGRLADRVTQFERSRRGACGAK
jgi:hypothetical protein